MRLQCGAAVKGLPFRVFVYYSSMSRPAITSFTLKVVAIVGMTCNHVANIFAMQLPGWATVALCSMGGLTFPIMAFLLGEGYRYTSNIRSYALRLAVFAALSQIPYSLLWGATANVLVTLLLGLGVLWAYDHIRKRALFFVVFAAVLVASAWCDWGIIGPLMIYLFYRLRREGAQRAVGLTMLVAALALGLPALEGLSSEALLQTEGPVDALAQSLLAAGEGGEGLLAVGDGAEGQPALVSYTVNDAGTLVSSLGALGYATIGFGLAALLLVNYNGRRGRPLKWLFYWYYPAHLLVLWGLAQII